MGKGGRKFMPVAMIYVLWTHVEYYLTPCNQGMSYALLRHFIDGQIQVYKSQQKGYYSQLIHVCRERSSCQEPTAEDAAPRG